MSDAAEKWLAKAQEILALPHSGSLDVNFAISILAAIYGPQSPQLVSFKDRLAQIAKIGQNPSFLAHSQGLEARAAIRNTVAEIEAGLISNLRAQVTGEVLADLIGLGKERLSDGGESAKNVSAVLIAAAFEDLIRRMGADLAAVTGRPKL
jgi:hypothetical protein